MKGEEISHEGKIVEITPGSVIVEIVSSHACGSCHAAGLCSLSGAVTKAIEVPVTGGMWSPGQEVRVNLKKTMGYKAVWIAYVGPLAVMICVLLALMAAGLGELPAGLAAIAAVGVYYLIVWLFRDRLRNEYSFYIKEK